MQVGQETLNGRLVLTPHGSLLCAGPAEQFEALLQNVLADGHRHLIVVLEDVPHVDSGGVRALVRGHLTAQRLGGSIALASIDRRVHRILTMMRLDMVFPIFDDGRGRDCGGAARGRRDVADSADRRVRTIAACQDLAALRPRRTFTASTPPHASAIRAPAVTRRLQTAR